MQWLTVAAIFLFVIVVVAAIVVGTQAVQKNNRDGITHGVVVGGRTYRVLRDKPNSKAAAALLDKLTKDVNKLVAYMVAEGLPTRERADIVGQRWRACNAGRTCLREISTEGDALAWIMGKQGEMAICLRTADTQSTALDAEDDYNTAMYIMLHEMAHLMSESYLHCAEFQGNFKLLCEYAARPAVGIYHIVDYTKLDVVYCGGMIRTMPGNTEECELPR